MALPFFYFKDLTDSKNVVLDEDTSKHIVQVLRMQNDEQLQLTDGKGNLFTCEITDNNRKRCAVAIKQTTNHQRSTTNVSIAISLLKNSSRFEWFLEKATEIGVNEIIPLICERTEKTSFKHERMSSILISAMLQSQQTYLPLLHEPVKYQQFISRQFDNTSSFIAHCEDESNKVHLTATKLLNPSTSKLILIGPEGDFTKPEIELALKYNFTPVSIGDTRLRTETAGMVAAALLKNFS
jgi:16S rRNA (uracil1498-N3)-methyltransferase